MSDKLKPLIIGDLEIKIPIIQGGMGVKVSTASLAAAVANCGGAGTIASVGLAYGIDGQIGVGLNPTDRGDIDDISTPLLHH